MKNRIILIAIIALAFVLRVYQLNSIPVSVSWDEAAIGYNAYPILKTGKDEYSKPFPLLFKSFSDRKVSGYVYSVAAFGESKLASIIDPLINKTFLGFIPLYLKINDNMVVFAQKK